MIIGDPDEITSVVLQLDQWLDTMRVDWPTPGYGGAVVHWWNHSLSYRGTGLDWRYEGIIAGYLTLWDKTGRQTWLEKAVRAGEDLVAGQQKNGHYRNSAFERNPTEGGTPHEAAADIGLLLLAEALKYVDPSSSDRFLTTAQRNLNSYWFGKLWDEQSATLWDQAGVASFVPNKAATFVEAVLLLARIKADSTLVERYAVPTGDNILAMQMRHSGHQLDGGIAQNRFGDQIVQSFFPIYIARCVPSLFQLFKTTRERRFHDGGLAAASFLLRVREPDGSFPQVVYANGHQNRYPKWIAATGDIVRAFVAANRYGAEIDLTPTLHWILNGTRSDGRIATAEGFGRIMPLISRRDRFADELGVVGWSDKAFRALAGLIEPVVDSDHTTKLPTLHLVDRTAR